MAKQTTKPKDNSQNFIEKPILGIEQNYQNEDNPSNVCTFALNAILENDSGKITLSRENSNLLKQTFISTIDGTNYQVVGFIYGDNNIVYYFLSNGTNSEIGYTDENNNYHSVVNFDDLNFNIQNQISGVYRLRLGCEKTIYWTEQGGTAPIRYFNFNKEEYFKNDDGSWNLNSFNLFYSYSIPQFDNIEVIDSGMIYSGSYNVNIQLLDENLNGTPWLQSTNPMPVYISKPSLPYSNIQGSSNYETDILGGTITHAGKSIKVEVSNLDTSFSYYRLALIEASSFNKTVSKIYVSNPIPITQLNYIFSGNPSDTLTENTSEEDLKKRFTPFTASHLEQHENRLIASDLKGKQYNFCNFQKYASKIASGYFVGTANAKDVNSLGNPKNPKTSFIQMAYHGFEVYAFGIVYVFPDFETPAYHIPGRPMNKYWDFDTNTVVDTAGENSPMLWNGGEVKPFTEAESEVDYNASVEKVQKWEIRDTSARISGDWGKMAYFENKEFTYLPKESCDEDDYWGVDFDGVKLEDTHIRHHRFPSRRTEPQVTLNGTYVEKESLNIKITYKDGYSSSSVPCCGDSSSSCITDDIHIYVTYDKDTIAETYTSPDFDITEIDSDDGYSLYNIDESENGPNAFDNIVISVIDCEGNDITFEFDTEYTITEIESDNTSHVLNTLGIQFTNIEYPHEDIIGHYIVVAERDDFNRTILDSGFAKGISSMNTSFMKYAFFSYIVHPISESTRYLLGFFPSFYFKNAVLKADYIRLDSYYSYTVMKRITKEYEVKEDGQRNAQIHSRVLRANALTPTTEGIYEVLSQKELNALSYDDSYIATFRTINHSLTNKVLLNQVNNPFPGEGTLTLPYVSLCVNRQIHTDLFNITYYRTHPNLVTTLNEPVPETYKHQTYGGDTYVTDFQYNNTLLYHTKANGWKMILLIAAAVVAAALTLATCGGLGAVAAGVIASLAAIVGASSAAVAIASVTIVLAAAIGANTERIKNYRDNFKNHLLNDTLQQGDYGDIANQGVDITGVKERDVYLMEGIFDTYIDSEINTSLRQDLTGVLNSGEKGSVYRGEEYYDYARKKILIFDDEDSTDKNQYWYNDGIVAPEIYHINPDYMRKNFQSVYFSLPFTYDCCSDCLESFEGRTAYSEQSFQEELVDHYRIFLPNNYRDIEGGSGRIKNIFKKSNKLYLHTSQFIWEQPASTQMQNTSDLVTYLGTGEFFSLPPQKILDDQNSVFGTEHKWSLTKSKYGYLYVSEIEKRIYLFQEQPVPISLKGVKDWSEEEIPLILNQQWLELFNTKYPLNDNPYNPLGIGFISTFDNKYNRYLITKKDYKILAENTHIEDVIYEDGIFKFIFEENIYEIGDLVYSNGIFYKITLIHTFSEEGPSIYFCTLEQVSFEDVEYFENRSWTISYSVTGETWVSWHSYTPNIYISNNSTFFSILNKPIAELYEHNIKYDYCNFYGEMKPFITEVVFNNPLQDFTWEHINLYVRSIKQDSVNRIFKDEPYEFFNKVIFYNDYQTTGLKNITTKKIDYDSNFMRQQIIDVTQEIKISKEEGIWHINDIRNYLIDDSEALFTKDWTKIETEYPIDKIVNDNIIDHNKTWQELEMLRGKYLTMRLIYDGTTENRNKQLMFNYTYPYNIVSYR